MFLDYFSVVIFNNVAPDFPGGTMDKNPPANARDADLILELGRSPGVRNSNPLHYSCLENPMEIGAWQSTVHRVTD